MAKEEKTISYEQARDELQQVVSKLEGQTVSLEESMALWERGEGASQNLRGVALGSKKETRRCSK
jgi:exodeoxyribonuclease VII small subunit